MALLDPTFAGECGVFVALAMGKVARGFVEQRRGVGHRRVKPLLVEAVAEIVMGVDVAFRSRFPVPVEPMLELLPEADERLVLEHLGDEVVVCTEQPEKFCEIGGFPFATQKGFSNSDIAAFQDAAGEVVIIDHHFRSGARPQAAKFEGAAIGKADEKCAILDAGSERECVADKEGQSLGVTGDRSSIELDCLYDIAC